MAAARELAYFRWATATANEALKAPSEAAAGPRAKVCTRRIVEVGYPRGSTDWGRVLGEAGQAAMSVL